MSENWGEDDKPVATAINNDQDWGAGDLPAGQKPAGALRRLKQGISNTVDAARVAATNSPEEIAGIMGEADKNRIPASPAQVKMQEEIAPYVKRANEATGVVDNVLALGSAAAKRAGQFIQNPSEFAGMVAENLPNSAPGMAGGLAGAAVGSSLGPVGTAVGGVVGGTAGGYAVEQGSSMQEQIQKEAQARGVSLQDKAGLTALISEKYPEFLEASRLKGIGTAGTDAVLNVATMGIAGAGGRAIAKEARALGEAAKAGKIGATEAAQQLAGIEAKNAARNTLGATVKRGAGITGAEMLGEGASEAVGQKLGYGHVDAGDVIDESLLGLGTGVGMAASQKVVNKITGSREFDPASAEIKRASESITPPVSEVPPSDQSTGVGAGMGGTEPFVPPAFTTNPQPTTLGTQTTATAGPGFDVNSVLPKVDPVRDLVQQSADAGGPVSAAALVGIDSGATQLATMDEKVQAASKDMPADVADAWAQYRAESAALQDQPGESDWATQAADEERQQGPLQIPPKGMNMEQRKANLAKLKERMMAGRNNGTTNAVQSLPATGSGIDGNQQSASMGLGNADGNGLGADAGGYSAHPVVQSGEQPTAERAVTDKSKNLARLKEKVMAGWPQFKSNPQPTTLGTQTTAQAGPTFDANYLPKQGNQNGTETAQAVAPETQRQEAPAADQVAHTNQPDNDGQPTRTKDEQLSISEQRDNESQPGNRIPTQEESALISRRTKIDKTLDLMSDAQIDDVFTRANLAGKNLTNMEKRDALKQEHPDDIEPLLKPQPAQPAVNAGEGAGGSQPTQGASNQLELVRIKSIDGKHYHVQQSDLDSGKSLLPTYTANGKRSAVRIHRENLDPTGEKQAANNAEDAQNPLFNVITTKNGAPFGDEAAANRALKVQKRGDTHEVVPASEVKPGMAGFVLRRKVNTGDKNTANKQVSEQKAQTAKDYVASVEQAKKDAQQAAQDAPRETVTPAEDKPIGKNDAGEQLYERKDGSVYRMRDGKPDFGGDLAPKQPSAPATTASDATENVADGKQPSQSSQVSQSSQPGNEPPSTPEVKTYTAEDVAAAEKQAAQQIEAKIDKLKGDAFLKIAKRFLPTMGVKPTLSKASNKAAFTGPKVNLLAAASELGVELSASVRAALEAKQEGKVQEAANDRVPEQSTISHTDAHAAAMQAVREGTATPEHFKASFEAVVANKDAIKAELMAKTKAELLKIGGPFVRMRMSNENKADIVSAVYRGMLEDYVLGEGFSYGMEKDSHLNAIRRIVDATDADKLAQYVKARKAAMEEYAAQRAAKAAALENPQTLDDYRALMRQHFSEGKTGKEAFLMLTPEQRVRFDELSAESTKESREARKRAAKTEVRAAGQTTGGEIIATKHTRDGYDLFVVKLAERVSKEDYTTLLGSAKRMGGWYSAFRGNGAIPGFQFKDKANAEAFLKLAAGDTTEAKAKAAERRDAFEDDRSQSAVERLTEMADRLEERATEALNAERKVNTERRARFAASAEASANSDSALAKTMRNIAQAISDGKAKFLDAVRQKVQVEMLRGMVRTAKDEELRAKYPSYADQEKHRGEKPTDQTADFAEFPSYTAFRSDLASLARQMLEVDGTKKLGQQLMKVADDVTDAFTEFAKANSHKLMRFSTKDGKLAAFSTQDKAQTAIDRSGFKGKAIPFMVKRGEWTIITSPSEAINQGIWKGDGDKRITLTRDFGNELVQAIGRRGNKQNQLSVPWQFENANTRLKALSRMGIETSAEFRSALREFIRLQEQPAAPDKVKELERSMVGRRNDGMDFFPTPQSVADEMVQAAGIEPGMAVLEPSAGMGHIAERIRETGVEPDVVEMSNDRRELLEAKGFNLVGNDFLTTEGQYDRIVMNPPFSDGRDIQHVQHAYSLLKPGGRLVAIMGESAFTNQNKRATEFREWLESVGGTEEKLPDGSFMDPSLPVNTGVNARMVVIDKQAEEAPASFNSGDRKYSVARPLENGERASSVSPGFYVNGVLQKHGREIDFNRSTAVGNISHSTLNPLQLRMALGKHAKTLAALERKGLVTLTQTQDQAVTAAAQARAAITGEDAGDVKRSMLSAPEPDNGSALEKWQSSLRDAVKNPQAKDPRMATPTAIRMLGAKAANLILPRTYLSAILDKHQDVPASVFENLPALLADPLFIISHRDGGLRVFVQAQTTKGEPIVVGLSIGSDGRIQTITPFNDDGDAGAGIRRRNYQVSQAFNRGERMYARNNEALEQVRASATAAPGLIPLHRGSVSKATVITRSDVVKRMNAGALDIKRSTNGQIQGFYDPITGKSFLIADALTAKTVTGVLMHEVGIHMAADGSMNALFDRAGKLMESNDPFMARVRERMKLAGEDGNEEAAAYIAEEFVNDEESAPKSVKDWISSVYSAIRAWMFRKGIVITADHLTPADIAAVARANVKALADGTMAPASGSDLMNSSHSPEANALRELSKIDDMFVYPKSDKTDMAGIIADNRRGIKFKESSYGNETLYKLTIPNVKGEAKIWVRKPNPYGPSVYGMDLVDGEATNIITERPGNNPEDVPSDTEDVYIDVSDLKEGDYGALIYNIAATYAHNTGRIFIGDPNGLSDVAMRRRLENMISTAIKFGTTDHIAPHPKQVEGNPAIGVPPLEWVYGDSVGNLERMIDVSLQSSKNAGNEEISYEPDAGNFTLTTTSGEVLAGEPGASAERLPSVPGSHRKGWRTDARRAIFDALLREEGQASSGQGRRNGLLERLLSLGNQRNDATRQVFYSRRSSGAVPGAGAVAKSAIGNNADIRFSRSATLQKVGDVLNESFNYPGTVSKWHTTVGSMYNLAERNQDFKQVFNATQDFLNDVSYYGTEAADMAPKIMPKLETLKDLVTKQPISYEDNKAIAAPIFQGTLSWARDVSGKPVLTDDLKAKAADMTAEQKAKDMLRAGKLDPNILRMWQGMEQDHYEAAVNSRYENVMLKPGVVWTDAELKSIFKLNDAQVGLYHEFRNAINTSIDNAAKAAMLRTAGKDVQAMRDMVMDAPTAEIAGLTLRDHLQGMAQDNPDRSDELIAMANEMMDQADKAETLKKEGYAPLSRFGHYTVDVVVNGERKYFSMFESKKEANRVANLMRQEYGAGNVAQATMSEREFEQFQGITPESMELFGNMLGLDSTGNEAQDKAFQTYLRKTKANRSAMKRLIHRKGIAGYSEDVGRVLAAFVYSNARQTAGALNLGKLSEAVNETQGELKDVAIGLQQYVTKPQEEAQAIRGLMFAQYLGGSIASMMVNLTQPMAISFPYLSQYGAGKAAKALTKAYADMKGGDRSLENGLQQALKIAEEQGIVAPQEVHQLMAQAQGKASLHGGDGTKLGNFMAKSGNAFTKLALGWGKLFGWAEQVNRKATFIAAYRMAAERGDANPFDFAKKAVNETQFINNRGNKMRWGRGAVGATLMTFKSYSINYLELLHRMATRNGPEGKKAAAIMLGMLLLMAGAGGLPFADDLNDLLDFLAQRMGYNFSTKKAKQEFLDDVFGKSMADFIDRGITGLPGSPIDVSGRMSMANLLPGTGLLLEKRDHSKDAQELLGPVGDMAKRAFTGVNSILDGDIKKALLSIAPKAISNAAQGFDMSQKGYYADTKGYKVLSTTPGEAVAKAIGFQPQSVSMVQESNAITQRMKDTYALHAEKIRSEWAKGVFEHDPDQIQKARDMLKEWNDKNPDQRIIVRIPDVMKKARDMAKDKEQRIADTAPKAMRAQLQREIQQRRALQ